MRLIKRYEVFVSPLVAEIVVCKSAKILHVAEVYKSVFFWAEIDTEAGEEKRKFTVLYEENIFNDKYEYKHIGSFPIDKGEFVAHLYEVYDES